MRVLFVSFPWATHFQPMVPLAWALQTAGHEVRVASAPEVTDAITATGLTAVPVGPDTPIMEKMTEAGERMLTAMEKLGRPIEYPADYLDQREELLTWPRLRWLTLFLADVFERMNDSMIEDLVEYCRWWQPDLVVWESLSYAGSVAATAVGAAHARMPPTADLDAQFRRHFLRVQAQQAPEDRQDAMADWLGGWAQKFGASFSEDMMTGQFTIDQTLGSMRLEPSVPRVPLRYVPYHGTAVVPDWLRRDPSKPRVLATFGVSQQKSHRAQPVSVDQLRGILDSLADLDIELVVTASEQIQQQLGHIPDNTRMVQFVPLNVIIPSCSAVLHHGGVPAFMNSVAHGVPQMMVSGAIFDIGVRGPALQQSGAGLWIPPDQPEELAGPRIPERLVRLLDEPAFRQGAERLREELLAQPTPHETVRELELLTERYRSR